MILIRKADAADAADILRMTAHYTSDEEQVAGLIDKFMVCEVSGAVCGCGCSVIHEDKCLINWVYVDKAFRNNSCGYAIVKALLNIADLQGIQKVYAAGNCERFFTKLGFKALEERSEELAAAFTELYGESSSEGIYYLSLIDYFNNSCKGTC